MILTRFRFKIQFIFINSKSSRISIPSFFEKNEDDINLEFYLENPLKADIYKEKIQKS